MQYTQASNPAAFGSLARLAAPLSDVKWECSDAWHSPVSHHYVHLYAPRFTFSIDPIKQLKKDSHACLLLHFSITGFTSLALPDICHPYI